MEYGIPTASSTSMSFTSSIASPMCMPRSGGNYVVTRGQYTVNEVEMNGVVEGRCNKGLFVACLLQHNNC